MTEPLSRAQRVRQLFEERNYVLASVNGVLEVMGIVESEEIEQLRAQLAQYQQREQDAWLRFTVCTSHDDFLTDLDALLLSDFQLKEQLAQVTEHFKTMSTIEIMCENYNVKAHIEEWEVRCLKAEQQLAEAQARIKELEARP